MIDAERVSYPTVDVIGVYTTRVQAVSGGYGVALCKQGKP